MEFIEKIRQKFRYATKKELAEALGKDPQSFYSLERATDRISLRDIVALRRLQGMSDKMLLDFIEEESKLEVKPTRRPQPQDSSEK